MADSTNVNYYPTWLYYKLTIFNAEGCTLNIKLQRITLTGHAVTLSEKEYTGNHLHLSAADKVSGCRTEIISWISQKCRGAGMLESQVFTALSTKCRATN